MHGDVFVCYTIRVNMNNFCHREEPLSDIQFPILDDGDDNGDSDQVLHLEGLGLEINIVNDSSTSLTTEEDSQKWSQSSVKQEPCDTKYVNFSLIYTFLLTCTSFIIYIKQML